MSNDQLCAQLTVYLSEKLEEARAEIKRLQSDITILTEELERERAPKCDER